MTTATDWITRHAHPLTTFDPDAPLTDLEPVHDRARDATVVAIGASVRHAHELSTLSHRILRLLVERLEFRSLAMEGDESSSALLDEYVVTGAGDPRGLLAAARSFWRTEELLDVVHWLRDRNELHPDDPVRVVSSPPVDSPDDLEELLAANTIDWHDRTGHKIAYWGGFGHTAVRHRSAGGHLRERFGPGYVSLGLTFHHGIAASPPAELVDATLGAAGLDAYVLDLHADPAEWLTAPTKIRLIGPAEHHLSGSLATWFDLVAHVREVTPVRPIR